jgi:hypothetical protein
MNWLANFHLALRRRSIPEIDEAGACKAVTAFHAAPAPRPRADLSCVWKVDPSTGRPECVWSSS